MKNWRGATAFTAAFVCICQPLCANPAAPPAPEAGGTRLQIVDARPSHERADDSSRISIWLTSCNYGIYRMGDPKGSPGKLDVLRTDLETALGDTLKGKTLTVSNYGLYLNFANRAKSSAWTIGFTGGLGGQFGLLGAAIGGGLGSFFEPGKGSSCSREETPEGWYEASEVSSDASPLIVQLTATLDGKSYSVRVVQTPSKNEPISDDPIHAYAAILHRANQALGDKIAGRFGTSPDEPVLAFRPATAKNYAAMLPLGIGSAGAVDAGSMTAANFARDPHGVAVGTLESDGTAARAGIRPGDVITEIDGARIDTVGDLQFSVARASGTDVNIQLNRSGTWLATQVHL